MRTPIASAGRRDGCRANPFDSSTKRVASDNGGGRVIGTELLPDYREYVAYLRDPQNGFASTTLPFRSGTEYSVRVS